MFIPPNAVFSLTEILYIEHRSISTIILQRTHVRGKTDAKRTPWYHGVLHCPVAQTASLGFRRQSGAACGRFRRFSVEKPAGYGVFPRRMSVEKRMQKGRREITASFIMHNVSGA